MTVSQEWTDAIDSFFVGWEEFMQIKGWLKMFLVDMVKTECHQSGELTVSEEWTVEITDLLYVDAEIHKSHKLIKYFLGGHGQKMSVASLVMGL